MMKVFLCLALCAFVAALPSAEVDPTAVVPESITETPDIALMEASFNDAKATVAAMIQEHGDDSACKDLAQATQDEVISAVAHQQKALAGMPKGDQCNDEGQGLINEAKDLKATAEKAKADAQAALNVENSKKFNFGDFSFEELTEGECNTFFNSGVYTDAKSKVVAAKAVLAQKVAEAAAAATAVETQTKEAANLVKECKCKTKKLLDNSLAQMNSGSKADNTKAWNKAHHMECVLAGKTTNECQVPALPVVVAVPYGEGVEDACGIKCSNGAGDTFEDVKSFSDEQIASAACESHMKAKNTGHKCKQARCGDFHYFYDGSTMQCSQAKPDGLYEWVYKNTGSNAVGQDYGQGNTARISGMKSFVRVRRKGNWALMSRDYLGQGCAH
jgi:hypothetical protein